MTNNAYAITCAIGPYANSTSPRIMVSAPNGAAAVAYVKTMGIKINGYKALSFMCASLTNFPAGATVVTV
jgi:hypothetical protein